MLRAFDQMKCFRVPRRLLICLVGFVICTPFARANDARSSHSISHEEAERHATDSDSYTKLCGDVALKIEGEVHWTGIAKHDADAALVEFKHELAKIDLSTAPARH